MEKYGDPWRISDLIKKKIYIFLVCLFCAGSIDGVLFLVTSWVQSFINIYSVNIVNLLDFGWEASDIVEGSSVSKIELFITKNAVSTVRRGKRNPYADGLCKCWRSLDLYRKYILRRQKNTACGNWSIGTYHSSFCFPSSLSRNFLCHTHFWDIFGQAWHMPKTAGNCFSTAVWLKKINKKKIKTWNLTWT